MVEQSKLQGHSGLSQERSREIVIDRYREQSHLHASRDGRRTNSAHHPAPLAGRASHRTQVDWCDSSGFWHLGAEKKERKEITQTREIGEEDRVPT